MPVRRVGPLTTPGGRNLGVTGAQMGSHGVESGLVDERRHFDGDYFTDRFRFFGLAALVGLRDRHACGSIVHDAPCLNVVLNPAAKARPGTRHDI